MMLPPVPRPWIALALLLAAPAAAQTNVTGWHAAGQTWIVWETDDPDPATYRVFASTTDMRAAGTTAVGVEAGRLLRQDWTGSRLRVALPGQTFRVPLPDGTYRQLTADEGVFAFTPHQVETLYFAVVKDGATTVTNTNGTEGIAQTLDPVTAHLQGTRLTPGSGQTLHVFAHWLDGRPDHTSGRPEYPVMGNRGTSGTSSLVLVTEPVGGDPGHELPAILALHGGGGHFMKFIGGGAPEIGLALDDAWVITPDGTTNTVVGPLGCAWLGYWDGFDRFADPTGTSVPDGSLVVDYLTRRVLWQLDWVVGQFPVDVDRIALLGHSGGARGVGQLARVYPERFSAVHMYCAAMKTGEQNFMFGDRAQNLPTTLPGSVGVADLANEAFFPAVTERDTPFTRIVIGRADTTETATWGLDKVLRFAEIDASRMGRHLYFDERGHGASQWQGAYFNESSLLRAERLLRHRVDASFPAFFGDDQDPFSPGRQPDMGNGDPLDGDPHGTYGGYYDWDQETLVDRPAHWACTFWLRGASANPRDEFPGTLASVGVAVRRPRAFTPSPAEPVLWRLVSAANGTVLQSGCVYPEANGLVSVEGLAVPKDPDRVRLVLQSLGGIAPQ